MDSFDKAAGAQIFEGGNYIKDGVYDFTILNVKHQNGHKGETFIVEFLVDSSKASEPGVEPNAVGSTCALVCNVSHPTAGASALSNFKACMVGAMSALGYTEAQVTGAELRTACGPGQPLRGVQIKSNTYRKSIKSGANAGKPMVVNKWSANPQTPEQIKARRSDLEGVKESVEAPSATPSAQTSMLSKLG